LIKILFELSLSISRFANFSEIGNITGMFIIVITKYLEIVLKSKKLEEKDLTDSSTYQDFSLLVGIEEIYEVSLAFCSFFYPFRIFQFLARYNIFSPAKTIINTLSRTTPGIFVYFVCIIIIYVSWA